VSLIREVPRVRVVSSSEAMQRVEREALKAAQGDTHVLVTGERGVGKGALARFIHDQSARATHGFGVINCKGLPDLLFESELFGQTEGRSGGAYRDKPGLLKSVHGGTIFLDEVSALSERMQARLLRAIEGSEYMRFGEDGIHVRRYVRFIASTETDLRERTAAGLFLDDLYRRLKTVHLRVPALRERREDIPAFVDHFAAQFSGTPKISNALRDALCHADWPGNVKELKSVVMRQVLAGATSS
jgi:two-component system response regulator AtoC